MSGVIGQSSSGVARMRARIRRRIAAARKSTLNGADDAALLGAEWVGLANDLRRTAEKLASLLEHEKTRGSQR